MMKPLLILISFFVSVGLAFSQQPDWRWQDPLPQGNDLKGVYGLGGNRFITVGSKGTILINSPSAGRPQLIPSGTNQNLRSVFFSDSLKGWAVGENGTLIHSINGGKNWMGLNSGTSYHLNRVFFLDSLSGWVVGDHGTILKTIDGGQSWVAQATPTISNVLSIHFTTVDVGLAGTQGGHLYKTSNGGQTWVTVTGGATGSGWKLDIRLFSPQSYVLLCINGQFIRTTNGGQTWTQKLLNVQAKALHFSDSLHGCVVGQNGEIWSTVDGGSNWEEQGSGTYQDLNSVYFDNLQNGWIVSNVGNILSTSNGGDVWSSLTNYTSRNLGVVRFLNRQLGCAIGAYGTMLRTTNGGATWNLMTGNSTWQLSDMYFPKEQRGWAVGGNNIVRTDDFGATWTPQSISGNPSLRYVFALDSQKVWAMGSNLHKSVDGGTTWSTYAIGTNVYPAGIYFVNENQGWVVGINGKILHTADGGSTWQLQSTGLTTNLVSIHFSDSQNGWAAGDDGQILYTANGGINWVAQNSGTTMDLNKIWFRDGLKGWAVGAGGTILRTINGGVIWTPQESGTNVSLSGLSFPEEGRGWVVGAYGVILTTGNDDPPQPVSTETLITGETFEKTGNSCNTSGTPVPNLIIKALPGPFYSRSNSAGKYELKLPVNENPVGYNLKPVNNFGPSLAVTTVCPPSGMASVVVDTFPDTLAGTHFGMEIAPCHYLTLDLSSYFRRRCFKNPTRIAYVNQGSEEAPQSYVLVEFPEWVRPLSASIPHIVINDRLWRFNLGTVLPGKGGSFSLIDSVLCGPPQLLLGRMQCTKATIYPASDCPPPAVWNGANLEVSGRCVNGAVQLAVRNIGLGHMTDSTEYSLLMDSILVKSGKIKLASDDSLVLVVSSGGMSVTFSANQPQNHPFEKFVSTTIENCGGIPGSVSHIQVNHFPVSQSPDSKTFCMAIQGSYDPNDKQAFPIGFTANHVVKPGTEMEYRVRFQNTGNDTAFTVYVIDSLDNNLDPESIQVGAVSHPYELSMQTTRQGRTFLRFQFDNIMLPDSNTNELESHGFIQYRISPKTGIALGSQAKNEAAIYFDFNDPVWTNQTLTTFDNLVFTNPGLSDSVHVVVPTETRKSLKQLGLEIYPNPFTHTLHLKSASETPVTVSLCDVMGKVWKTITLRSYSELPSGELPPGIYYLQFPELGRVMKVVKEGK